MHKVLDAPVAIAGAARTPVGRFNGILRKYQAPELGALVIREAVRRSGVDPCSIQEVVMGNVVSGGLGQGPAKQAAAGAGLDPAVVSKTVNSVCGSGLAAVTQGVNSITLGMADTVVAGGMESCTNAPYLLGPCHRDGSRFECKLAGYRMIPLEGDLEKKIKMGDVQAKEATRYDGLYWPPDRKFMLEYAVNFATNMGYTADEINEAASKSYEKAREATEKGFFLDEIVPVDGIETDEIPSVEEEARMLSENPADPASGYNSSTPADGAAAVALLSHDRAEALGLTPLGFIRGYSVVNCKPEDFLKAPVLAVEELIKALDCSGHNDPFTVIEVNEAFGMQLLLFEESFKGMEINVHGGAVALGHPLGATGCRLLVTLLNIMKRYGHKRGLIAICFGGGGSYALAVEGR